MRQPHRVGVYALLIHVSRQETIRVGCLRPVQFSQGIYVYVGSALNSLDARISRHFSRMKPKHWHVDYLLGQAGVRLAGVAARSTVRRLECGMSRAIQRRALTSIVGFGCSDCKCESHLHYIGNLQTASNVVSEVGFRSSWC